MNTLRTLLAGTLILASTALPAPAHAQGARAGVVTTLQGTATVTRTSVAQPAPQVLPLKFRDAVFLQDRVATGEQSIARILLGGKAVVTVREHSTLTITETATTSTIDISAGKIALAVARDRMKPGERIHVRTPNAMAGVRGTVLVIEVLQATAQASGPPPGGITSRFTLLSGLVDVAVLDPATSRPGPSQFTIQALQQVGITGFTPPAGPRTLTRGEANQIASHYQVNLRDAPRAANAHISERQLEQASNAAAVMGASPGSGGASIISTIGTGGSASSPLGILPSDYQRGATPPPIITPPIINKNVGNNKGGSNPDCPGICEGNRALRGR